MFSMMIEEHNMILTTAENQAQCRNTPKPKNGALNFNNNEARVDSKSSKSTGDLSTVPNWIGVFLIFLKSPPNRTREESDQTSW